MSRYPSASDGLGKMSMAIIGSIVCALLVFIPVINILALIAIIVLAIISLVGLYKIGEDIDDVRTAFMLTIISIIASLFTSLPVIGTIAKLVKSLCSLGTVYFVCIPVAEVLRLEQHESTANFGKLAWKINIVTFAVAIVAGILVFFTPTMALAIAIIGAILEITGDIFYLIFLYRASDEI